MDSALTGKRSTSCPEANFCTLVKIGSPQKTSSPSCVPDDTISPLNVDVYCSTLRQNGYFRVESDSTCRQ
ncbi:uncharacterized protein LOC111073473 [Drosophila obscura]|uniref:uncharacterized protein LOC111073473 n=1 Tax=Drosophila obscura TaxID=7282 RepID=UPI001BB128A5|nr:uncharacterized protein LOC111073473 [Drosophila obscura]